MYLLLIEYTSQFTIYVNNIPIRSINNTSVQIQNLLTEEGGEGNFHTEQNSISPAGMFWKYFLLCIPPTTNAEVLRNFPNALTWDGTRGNYLLFIQCRETIVGFWLKDAHCKDGKKSESSGQFHY